MSEIQDQVKKIVVDHFRWDEDGIKTDDILFECKKHVI